MGLLMLSGGKTTIPYEKDTIPEKVAALYAANFHQFQNEVDALAAQTKNTNSINELGWEYSSIIVDSVWIISNENLGADKFVP